MIGEQGLGLGRAGWDDTRPADGVKPGPPPPLDRKTNRIDYSEEFKTLRVLTQSQ